MVDAYFDRCQSLKFPIFGLSHRMLERLGQCYVFSRQRIHLTVSLSRLLIFLGIYQSSVRAGQAEDQVIGALLCPI